SVLNSEVVTQGESEEWQKYKFTNDDGNYPLIDLQNKTENYYDLKTGVYYTTNTPHGISGVSTAGFSEMKIRISSTVKRLTFRPYNSNRIFEKWFYNEWSEWREIPTLPLYEEIETKNSAESRANETLADANRYTDEQFSKQHTVLFEGSANGVGQTINMTESMFNYNLIIVSGSTSAGDFDRPVLVNQNSGNNIIINIVNLVDSNGNLGSVYELKLGKTNETTLTIANDVFFDYGTNEGSGKDANRFTIKRIEGWK